MMSDLFCHCTMLPPKLLHHPGHSICRLQSMSKRNESTTGRKDKCTDPSTSHIYVDPKAGESDKTSKDESFTLSDTAGSLVVCDVDAVI